MKLLLICLLLMAACKSNDKNKIVKTDTSKAEVKKGKWGTDLPPAYSATNQNGDEVVMRWNDSLQEFRGQHVIHKGWPKTISGVKDGKPVVYQLNPLTNKYIQVYP